MKIQEEIIKSKKTRFFKVQIGDYEETFDSKGAAEEAIKRYEIESSRRAGDYLIAEKLFGYVWINFLRRNYLVHPDVLKTRYIREDEMGKLEGATLGGGIGDPHWSPPDYERAEWFLPLYAAICTKGFEIDFKFSNSGVVCHIAKGHNRCAGNAARKNKWWADEYLMMMALKAASCDLLKD